MPHHVRAAPIRESDIGAMTVVPKMPDETLLFVTVTVNGDDDSSSLVKVKRLKSGDFTFDRAGLEPLRFDMSKVPTGDWVPALALGPAKIDFDEVNLKMTVTVPPEFLVASTLTGDRAKAVKIAPATWGGLFNYQFFAQNDQTGKTGVYSLYGETRLLTPHGVLDNTGLYTDAQGRQNFIRYETTWHDSWPDKLLTATVGDLTTGGLAWTTPVRMAGFQLSKSFSLRPDLITFPVPSFSGSAAATSAVDLYVNNSKQYTGQVVSGPFTLNTVPNVTGAASADVVVHDALGRDTIQHLTFYVEPRLLAQGLDDYSIEAGFLRRYYGVEQAAYDRLPATSAVYRKGITDVFTLESHIEAGGAYHAEALGLGALYSFPKQLGVINLSALGNAVGGGVSTTLGYSNLHQRLGVYGSLTKTLGNYRDLSSTPGYNTAGFQWQSGVNFPIGRTGALGLNYIGSSSIPGLVQSSRRTAGLTYSVQPYGGLNLFVNALRDMGSTKSTSFLVGLSYSFTNGISLSTDAARSSTDGKLNMDVSAQRSPPYDEGFGWRVTGRNDPDAGSVTGMYRNALIDSSIGVGEQQKTTTVQANLSGSVLWMDHDILLGRNVNNGFALVSTDYPGIPVERENRPVGDTNSHGHVLVNDLNPYENTTITIDPRQLPPGVEAPILKQIVSTKADAGALVKFPVKPIYGALVTLNGQDGKPLPLGTTVVLNGDQTAPQVVGYDGQIFMSGLTPHNVVDVTLPNGTCKVMFDYTSSTGTLPHLGPFTCK